MFHWEDVLSHLDHLITHLGEDNVGLGSDFDGATIPQGIGDVAGLPALQQAMLDHQYGEALVKKLCCDNWLALLDRAAVVTLVGPAVWAVVDGVLPLPPKVRW